MINLRNIKNKTKEPLSYLSDVAQVGSILWNLVVTFIIFFNNPFTIKLKNRIQEFNVIIKLILGSILIYVFWYLINSTFNKMKYILEMNKLLSQLEKESINLTKNQLIENYKNIIPSTFLLKSIYKDFKLIATKWSSDCYLTEFDLNIWLRKNNKIELEVKNEFFSKKKEACINLNTIGMKIPHPYVINPSQIKCCDFSLVQTEPLYSDKKWRKFVVEGLERTERQIAGREFYLSIHSWLGKVKRFYLDSYFVPHRSFTFFLLNGEMFKDHGYKEKIISL